MTTGTLGTGEAYEIPEILEAYASRIRSNLNAVLKHADAAVNADASIVQDCGQDPPSGP